MPVALEAEAGKLQVWSQSRLLRPSLKIKSKKGWVYSSLVQYLPSMCKTLSPIPTTAKGKKTKQESRESQAQSHLLWCSWPIFRDTLILLHWVLRVLSFMQASSTLTSSSSFVFLTLHHYCQDNTKWRVLKMSCKQFSHFWVTETFPFICMKSEG